MLNLAADDEQQAVTEMTRALGLDVLSPAAAETEKNGAVSAAVWRALSDTGLTAPLAEELGGGGIPSAVTQMTAIEHLSYGDPHATVAAVWSGAAGLLISVHGTDAQKAAFGASGPADPDYRGSVALYESRGASDLGTTVEVSGDRVRVTGRKVAVPFAGTATTMVVVGSDPSTGGLRAVIVPPGQLGVTIKPGVGDLGLGAAQLGTVAFDMDVAADQVLGEEGLALSVARLRLALAAAQTGMAQRALEFAGDYGSQRIAFGKPIVSFQGISFLLAEAFARTEQARLEVLDVAAQIDAGHPSDAVLSAVSAAVSYASENAAETTRNAVQVLGGHGFMTEYPVENWYRTAALLSTLDFDPLASAFQPAF